MKVYDKGGFFRHITFIKDKTTETTIMERLIRNGNQLSIEMESMNAGKFEKELTEEQAKTAYDNYTKLVEQVNEVEEEIMAAEEKKTEFHNQLKGFNNVFVNWNPNQVEASPVEMEEDNSTELTAEETHEDN